MCGIVGYVGDKVAQALLFDGLRKLEYRGYDSAGISVIVDEAIQSVRAVGNLDALQSKLASSDVFQSVGAERADASGAARVVTPAVAGASATKLALPPVQVGIGHTRWATHGIVSEENAHPHCDSGGKVHVVVNGIIENYLSLKQRLVAEGCRFSSQTDAEVVAHLLAKHDDGDLLTAAHAVCKELHGRFAFVAISARQPHLLVGARKDIPLVLGRGDGEQFIASAVPGFLAFTRTIQPLHDGDVVELRRDGATILDAAGNEVDRPLQAVDWSQETAEKGGFATFMLKEIHEQPEAVAETLATRVDGAGALNLREESFDEDLLADKRRIIIVACGTSYHAGLIGRYAIEQWARLPVEMDIASEYRYREPVIGPSDLVIGISQSGETADTLAAMRLARKAGAGVLAITNVMGSQATSEADGVLFTRAGPEVSVAATKTFVCQASLLYLLALRLAEMRGTLPRRQLTQLAIEVSSLPQHVAQLTGSEEPGGDLGVLPQVVAVAERFASSEFFLYMGRNIGLPVALEGALKLKEIAYIATDAYAAGEMKHGPIALLDESTPVICVATDSPVLSKLAANMQEVKARGAHVIGLVSEGDEEIRHHLDLAIEIPRVHWMLQPVLAVVPLQMLAYEIAVRRGRNVDQPRNLAKTVTVE